MIGRLVSVTGLKNKKDFVSSDVSCECLGSDGYRPNQWQLIYLISYFLGFEPLCSLPTDYPSAFLYLSPPSSSHHQKPTGNVNAQPHLSASLQFSSLAANLEVGVVEGAAHTYKSVWYEKCASQDPIAYKDLPALLLQTLQSHEVACFHAPCQIPHSSPVGVRQPLDQAIKLSLLHFKNKKWIFLIYELKKFGLKTSWAKTLTIWARNTMGQDNQNLAQIDQPIQNQLTTISGDAVQCRKVIFDGEFCWFAVEKSQKPIQRIGANPNQRVSWSRNQQ